MQKSHTEFQSFLSEKTRVCLVAAAAPINVNVCIYIVCVSICLLMCACVCLRIEEIRFFSLAFCYFFFSSSCGVWLPGCALTLIFCVSALAATHKREHIHIYTQAHMCSTLPEGKAKKRKQHAVCVYIHRTEQLTFFT